MLSISSIILNYHHHHHHHHQAYQAHMNEFVLGRCSFRISPEIQAMLTEASHGLFEATTFSFQTLSNSASINQPIVPRYTSLDADSTME
jgi:hypothetical protein